MNRFTPLKNKIEEVPTKTRPEIDMDTLTSIDPNTLEDSYVYVHCHFNNQWSDMLIRIWKTTYLIDQNTSSRSALVHVENISYAPQWTFVPDKSSYSFLLIFSALPKSCNQFDLLEDIEAPGGFHIKNIIRNKTDVYHIDVF